MNFYFKLKDNKKIFVFVFLSIFFFSFFLFSFVSAQNISTLQNEINTRNEEIKRLQAEIDAYNSKVVTTQSEAKDLKTAISKLESQKKDILNQIYLTNLKIKNTEGSISNTVEKISENENTIDNNKKALTETLLELRRNDDSNTFFMNIIRADSKNFSDMLDNSFKISKVNDLIKEKIGNINDAISNLNINKSEYEKQKNELSNLSKDLNSRENLVEQNQKEKNTLLTKTKNQEKEYQKMIADRKSKMKEMEKEINEFETKIKYTLNKSKLPSNGTGLSWPLEKIVITQNFGSTAFSRSGAYNGNNHNGLDFGVSVGKGIFSAADGVVMGTGDTDVACKNASYGKWILIKHNNGLATLYGHLSSINVSTGQNVNQGDQIGLSGNTGYSTGPHLHFTVIAADAVRIFGPTEYKSRTCGTYMIMPYAPTNAYLNPTDYLPKR